MSNAVSKVPERPQNSWQDTRRIERPVGRRAVEATLTMREAEVIRGLARGLTYEQCAVLLAVSVNTIRTHVRSIYAKLEAADKVQAVLSAIERGLVSLDG
jgi:DNA-binding NarL/FixJ family response regulator